MKPRVKSTIEAVTKPPFNIWAEDVLGRNRDEKEMDGNYMEDDKRDYEEDSMESLTHQNKYDEKLRA